MSLVNTLAKAAIGIALAKGVSGMMSGGASRGGGPSVVRDSGGSSPYGGPQPKGEAAREGDFTDLLGQMLGSSGPRGRGSLGGALEELSQISTDRFSGPSGASRPFGKPSQGSFGDMLNNSLDTYGKEKTGPSREQEELAGILLRALIQAAKADGRIDASEKEQMLQHLGELDRAELDFVNAELAKPIDVAALVRDVPREAAGQVYMMSVMGIDLDTKKEAKYLHELSRALDLDPDMVNAIHDRMGEPRLYR
ncbi:DUF533 domain-containing protein [Ruegeria atlantica]|uniref:Inner membrane protein YebE n=1 Tax=Ruegeria atlantica TaxID=81569 RepID=A0A0N7LQS8_9RHOB|nr:DUF533 domain-containing protein [Ruegeria atlantica]CUH48860.1 hypothetical protein RUA4292_03050 [Ruegeria atlantica]